MYTHTHILKKKLPMLIIHLKCTTAHKYNVPIHLIFVIRIIRMALHLGRMSYDSSDVSRAINLGRTAQTSSS